MSATQRVAVGAPCWADLWTSDVDGSRTFYCDLFGWEAQEPSSAFGGYFMFTRDGAPIAGGMGDMGDLAADDTWKVYLSTEDIAGAASVMVALGASVLSGPVTVADLGQNMVFSDPGGARLGAWQPDTFSGFGARGGPGAPSWFELFTRDYAGALDFYRTVFAWRTSVEGDSDEFRYSTLRDPADHDLRLAGVMDASAFLPQDVPAHWSIYWDVDDTDASVARVRELGGALLDGPTGTPFGRMATVADPSGAVFKLRTPPSGG